VDSQNRTGRYGKETNHLPPPGIEQGEQDTDVNVAEQIML
jgi:hypothetical protein